MLTSDTVAAMRRSVPSVFEVGLEMDQRWENKAGYTATPVACGWAGAVFEVTLSLGQEQ